MAAMEHCKSLNVGEEVASLRGKHAGDFTISSATGRLVVSIN